jgi:iron complex transport system substrate-binding protein
LGVSAEGEETLAGDSFVTGMLTDLGLSDAATTTGAMTLAQLCKVDPDWLFVVYQGDEAAAQTAFAKDFQAQEEWATLSAAQQGRVVMLPKALFSQVPNAKWGEAYAYLSQVLYGSWA